MSTDWQQINGRLIILGLGVTGAVIGTGLGFALAAATGATMLLFHTCSKRIRNSSLFFPHNSSQQPTAYTKSTKSTA